MLLQMTIFSFLLLSSIPLCIFQVVFDISSIYSSVSGHLGCKGITLHIELTKCLFGYFHKLQRNRNKCFGHPNTNLMEDTW